MSGTCYAFRKKKNPLPGEGKFLVFQLENADLEDEGWKSSIAWDIQFETRNEGYGEVYFLWKNDNIIPSKFTPEQVAAMMAAQEVIDDA